jgi:hypothetical protein
MDAETAETVAAQGLAFLAEESARLRRFLLTSGLEPEDLRARAGTPDMLLAVLEHLAADESLLLVFAETRKVAPESIARAIALLQGHAP